MILIINLNFDYRYIIESRHDKAWNDPPLFSLDQMSKNSNSAPINKRYRYPQQTTIPSTNQPIFTTNIESNKPSAQQTMQTMQTNQLFPNEINQEMFDLNTLITTVNAMIATINNLPQDLVLKWHNIQNSLYSIQFENQTQINLLSLIRGIIFVSMIFFLLKIFFSPKKFFFSYIAIQSNDFNSGRLYSGNLTYDNNETVRTTALIISEILRYIL